MKYRIFCTALIFSCTACSSWMGLSETFFPSSSTSASRPSAATNAQADACRTEAQRRLPLYVHSDIYPLTDQEKADALNTLMSGCMKQYETSTTATLPPVAAAPPPALAPAPAPSTSPFGAPTPTTATPDKVPFAVAEPSPVHAPPAAPHAAVAAPVTSVSTITTTPLTPTTSAPFTVGVPPAPDLAAKNAHLSPPTLPPSPPPPTPHLDPGSAGAQQLQTIVDQP